MQRILINKFFFQCFLCLLSFYFVYIMGQISIYLSDHLALMCTPAKSLLNIWSKYMPNQSLKQTPADSAVCVLYEPNFLLKSRFREMSCISVLCLCPWCKDSQRYPRNLFEAIMWKILSFFSELKVFTIMIISIWVPKVELRKSFLCRAHNRK